MSASGVMRHVRRSDSSMANTLPSAEAWKRWDWCCGIHGAMKARRGIKHATACARRRNDRNVIDESRTDS